MDQQKEKPEFSVKEISAWLIAEMKKTEFGTIKAEVVMHDGECKYIELSKSEKLKI